MDGLNDYRTARVADILEDFRTMQYWIAAAPTEPANEEDYYTEGWATLRRCAGDGQNILECAADTRVPNPRGGELEQKKAELKQIHLDAFSRRHQGQKIYLRQQAALRWVDEREAIFQGGSPSTVIQSQLHACDVQLRMEVDAITDYVVYSSLISSDQQMGRWTGEDPSLHAVLRWLRPRV